jgi:hypothetical protein
MRLLPLAIAFSLTAVCYGDVITLKNGRTINGTYLGGTPRQIKVEVGDNIQTLDVGEIARIEFNGGGGGSDSAREAPRDNGRPTLRRADAGGSDSGSSSSGGSGSGGYGSGGSGGSGSRPVILQPDPNDTGSYPSSSSTASDNSRPTLRRAPSSSSTDSAPSSSGNSGSSSSSSNDGDRPVLHRSAPAPASDAGTPAAAPTAQPATQPQAPVAAAAPAPAAPPAPAPPPPTIKLGQTQDAVIAALGQPDSVSAEGNKQIYVYKSAKVTFVNGKVSKVE